MSNLRYGMRWGLVAVVVSTALAFAFVSARTAWRSRQVDDIYAAALRYRFETEFRGVIDREIFYVSVDDKDPDAQLMRQLRGSRPVVRRASEWRNPPGGGRRIGVGHLKWVGNAEAMVSWGTMAGSAAIWGYQCRVVRAAGGWRVAEVTHTSIADIAPMRH